MNQWIIALLAGWGEIQSEGAAQPNIIYVLMDDLGWGDVGFNGQQKIKTPFIDGLAAAGAVLKNYYSASPVCGPARASLMTGLHQGHCRVRGNPGWNANGGVIDLSLSDMTIPKELKRAGYSTACFGKWGLNEDRRAGTGNPQKQGFDEFWGFHGHGEAHFHWPDYIWHNDEKVDLGGKSNWLEKKTYADDLFTDKAVEFIQKSGDKPFFIYLAYTLPHYGISVPEDSQIPYRNLGWEKRVIPKDGHYRNDPEGNVSYAGMVSRADWYLQRVVAALKEKGIEEQTLIIFSSDNGHEYDQGFFDSNGDFTGGKRNVTEGGIRMPAFAYWRGHIKPGLDVEHICAFWDVLPTVCELAGIQPSAPTDGISFVPALMGKETEQKVHEYLYWEFNEKKGPMQAVRFGTWKALRLWDSQNSCMGAIQLYDLENDPSEQNNLASKYPEKRKQALQYMQSARSDDPAYPLTLFKKK